jgi:serine/threonine protein kinase
MSRNGRPTIKRSKKDAQAQVRFKYQSSLELLGKGAFGAVFLFTERANNQKVAVKVIRKQKFKSI